jgi:hypothetical protein
MCILFNAGSTSNPPSYRIKAHLFVSTMNLNYLFKYATRLGIKIDQNDFVFQFQSHPNYPSLLAISDTLDFKNIQHFAAEVDSKEINKLPAQFVANLEVVESSPEFIFCQRKGDSFRLLNEGKWIDCDLTRFEKIFRNIVLVLERQSEGVDESVNTFYWRETIFALLILLLLFNFEQRHFWINIFLCFSVIGTFVSYHAFMKELGLESAITKSMCSLTKNANCDSPKLALHRIKIFNDLGFGALSFAFFMFQLSLGLNLSIAGGWAIYAELISILFVPVILVTTVSLGYQLIVKKFACPICMIIILIIIFQAFTILRYLPQDFSGSLQLLHIVLINALLIVTGVIQYKNSVTINKKLTAQLAKANHTVRNYDLFNLALKAGDRRFECSNEPTGFVLGNPLSKSRLTVVSSLSCGACKDFHRNLLQILEVYGQSITIELKLLFPENSNDKKLQEVHFILYENYRTKSNVEFMKSILAWYEDKNSVLFESSVHRSKTEESARFFDQEITWIRANGVHFTPAVFVNGYAFPFQYENSELIYFIPELLDRTN